MFDKILIANRGEIACRVISTCRRLGIRTVAIYSDADKDALHVRLADEAYRVGPPAARESYLAADRIVSVATTSGAQAIHPGYGFLSENPDFAKSVTDAGLVFVGPSPASMEAMSSKATARALMERVGVPVLPGYQGERQDSAHLRVVATAIGYPVLIKAAAGGGGKGMRRVSAMADFDAALLACQREASASFGDARVVLEKYLEEPRHIEVQVFGDAYGNVVHLYERDCSAQRRHQKVIEESPAPGLSAVQREALTQAACTAARAVDYRGAGTVEFLFDRGGQFYFIEMNTRIQVEHPVTEMITGLDLVEWQLRVAWGEALPSRQYEIRQRGHAIEARLYAEVPEAGFLPSSGMLQRFELPAASSMVRVETGIESGDRVGIDYDPMLAKLIVHRDTRSEAITALGSALEQVRVAGLGTNLLFLRRLIANACFRQSGIDTGFIERHLPELLQPPTSRETPVLMLAAAALWMFGQERGDRRLPTEPSTGNVPHPSPWEAHDAWRLNGISIQTLRLEWGMLGTWRTAIEGLPDRTTATNGGMGQLIPAEVQVEFRPHGSWLRIDAHYGEAALRSVANDTYEVRLADRVMRLQLIDDGAQLQICAQLQCYRVRRQAVQTEAGEGLHSGAGLRAPMPGRVIAQLICSGEKVLKGTPLMVIEAMKMEHTLCAPANGTVRAFGASVGDQIQEGTELIDFEVTT